MAARQPAGPGDHDHRVVVVDHGVEWDGPNPNTSLRHEKKAEKVKGKAKGKAIRALKDPNAPDYEPIVLTKRFRRADSKIKKANEILVAHYNDMRNCRNSYIDAAVSWSGKDKGQRLKELAAEFKLLKSKTADHVAAVEKLNGHPVPMRDNLEKLPSVEQFTKGRPNAKKR